MSLRSTGVIGLAVLAALILGVPNAFATSGDRGHRDKEVLGGRDEETVYAGASYQGVVFDPPAGDAAGSLSPGSGAVWAPPPCYYAPRWKASEFRDFWYGHAEHMARKTEAPDTAAEIIRQHLERYGPDSEYADHNIDKEDEGSWWTAYANPDSLDRSGLANCDQPTFWVDHGDPPPVLPGVPDAEMLAELAYAQVDIPMPAVELSPRAGAQKVRLDTWVWLSAGDLGPVSVTASLDGFGGLSSTVTATPVRLTLEPGTADALVHGGADGCAIDSDGAVGEVWDTTKKGHTPPCGVTYLRATTGGNPYTLSATLTWSIAWEGSDGSGGPLPDGEFTTSQELTVEEIQTIVR